MRRSLLIATLSALLVVAAAGPASAQKAPKPISVTVVGKLVDYACYQVFGEDQTRAVELAACQEKGAAKNDRLALITPTGTYFAGGTFADKNNEKLRLYLNRMISVTGIVTEVDAAAVLAVPEPAGDTRRNPVRTGEINHDTTRRGNYREGDPRTGIILFLEPTTATLVE